MIQSRYYNVNGARWEARFFHKGDTFPQTELEVPRQGVWARPVSASWADCCLVGDSWARVRMDPDVLYLREL